jgi:pullulanase/glycogen debranching enzyme
MTPLTRQEMDSLTFDNDNSKQKQRTLPTSQLQEPITSNRWSPLPFAQDYTQDLQSQQPLGYDPRSYQQPQQSLGYDPRFLMAAPPTEATPARPSSRTPASTSISSSSSVKQLSKDERQKADKKAANASTYKRNKGKAQGVKELADQVPELLERIAKTEAEVVRQRLVIAGPQDQLNRDQEKLSEDQGK